MLNETSPMMRHLVAERKRMRREAILKMALGFFAGLTIAGIAWAGSWILYGLTH